MYKRKVLYIAEKPNVALALADAFGIKKAEDGFYIRDTNLETTVIGFANGHLFSLLDPQDINPEFKKWDIKNLPIKFDADKLKAISARKKEIENLKKHFKDADVIINAGDAGREGELIQRWIYKMLDDGKERKYKRLWVSALTRKAILKANKNLIDMDAFDDLYKAGETRSIADKFMGINYSRALSLTKTDGLTITYGRCQSPILAEIVRRDREIENFVPEPFSYIKVYTNELEFTLVDEELNRVEFKTEKEAADFLTTLPNKLIVTGISHERKIKHPPKPYSLLTLQKEMAAKYDFTADKTLSVCQKLYMDKLITYPRTDSEYLSNDMKDDVKDIIKALDIPAFSQYVKEAEPGILSTRYFNDAKVTDHTAIIPTDNQALKLKYDILSEDERIVFSHIAKRFISLFYPPCASESIKAIAKAGEHLFLGNKSTLVEKGYLKVVKNIDAKDMDNLPELNENTVYPINEKRWINDTTKPKARYTTESLLSLMKIYKIGTAATQAEILKNLLIPKGKNKESYVEKKNKGFYSTDFGRKVSDIIPEQLKSLDRVSKIEMELKEIETGSLSEESLLSQLYSEAEEYIKEFEKESENDEGKIRDEQPEEPVFFCPVCARPLIKYKKGYGCSGYKEASCNFFLSNEKGGKKLTENQMLALLLYGETDEIKGFKSKNGKTFSSKLILDNGKVLYEFQLNNGGK